MMKHLIERATLRMTAANANYMVNSSQSRGNGAALYYRSSRTNDKVMVTSGCQCINRPI